MPIVSSNGSTPETGVVWLINRAEEPFSVEAYDAVYVPGANIVQVYGLTPYVWRSGYLPAMAGNFPPAQE
jgi:hypothetical protein